MKLEDMNGRKIMVSWSGGLDSTWALWRLLTETDAEVRAHHVGLRFVGENARRALEERAVDACAEWLAQHARPFKLTRSRVNIRDLGSFKFWAWPALRPAAAMAALAAGLGEGDVIVIGINAADAEGEAAARADDTGECRITSAIYSGVRPPPGVTWIEPLPSRAQEAVDLPPDLVVRTWSCRDPMKRDGAWRPCRICGSCVQLADVLLWHGFAGRHLNVALRDALKNPNPALADALTERLLVGRELWR